MAGTADDIIRLVTQIVTDLVDDADAVVIEASEEEGALHVDVTVAEEETGKVIGRKGRIIKAIRTISRAAASQGDLDVEVEVIG